MKVSNIFLRVSLGIILSFISVQVWSTDSNSSEESLGMPDFEESIPDWMLEEYDNESMQSSDASPAGLIGDTIRQYEEALSKELRKMFIEAQGREHYITSVSATTKRRDKHLIRRAYIPDGWLLCTGRARTHHTLGDASGRIYKVDPAHRYVDIRMKVRGGAGRGKIVVSLFGSVVPEDIKDFDVKCDGEVLDQITSSNTCSCNCLDAENYIRRSGVSASPKACSNTCSRRGLRGSCN